MRAQAAPPEALARPETARFDTTVTETDRSSAHQRAAADPFVAALAHYVEALHRRYPDGPNELRRAGLDSRAKVSQMVTLPKDPAA